MPVPFPNPDRFLPQESAAVAGSIAEGLNLGATQAEQLNGVDASAWLAWSVSALGGKEAPLYTRVDDPYMQRFIPSPALPMIAGERVMWGGQRFLDFERGSLAVDVERLYKSGDTASLAALDRITTACANLVLRYGLESTGRFERTIWDGSVPRVPQTCLEFDYSSGVATLHFSGEECDLNGYRLDNPPKSVVTYGPGFSGSTLAHSLFGAASEIHYVNGGLSAGFLSKFIKGELDVASAGVKRLWAQGESGLARLRDAGCPDDMAFPEGHFYNGGISCSIRDISANTVDQGSPVDVVLMSSVHSAGTQECLSGVKGAKLLLRRGGLLVVKAPKQTDQNECGLDAVNPLAVELFGNPVAEDDCGLLRGRSFSSDPVPAGCAVYQNND